MDWGSCLVKMNKEKKILLKIEKLKDEKENIKFGYDKFSNFFLSFIIFFATTAIILATTLDWIVLKITSLVSFLVIILLSYFLFFKPALSERVNWLNDKAEQIKREYSKLKIE